MVSLPWAHCGYRPVKLSPGALYSVITGATARVGAPGKLTLKKWHLGAHIDDVSEAIAAVTKYLEDEGGDEDHCTLVHISAGKSTTYTIGNAGSCNKGLMAISTFVY